MISWLAETADRRSPFDSSLRPGWPEATAGMLRLWHGQPGPVHRVHQVDVPGCHLFVVGCCTTPMAELPDVARRLARGDTAALAAVDGSRVVIAVRPDDVLAVGDLAGQCPVFYANSGRGVLLGSDARLLADEIGAPLDPGWLAARMILPSASDVWWEGSPWQQVRALRPGWTLRVTTTRATAVRGAHLDQPSVDLGTGAAALQAALHRAISSRMAGARLPTADLSGGMDSSSVVALAAQTGGPPVRALTIEVEGVEDVAAARHVAGAVPNIVHETMPVPDSVIPYSALDNVPAVDEPSNYLVGAAWARWWRRTISEGGSDVHLTGDGGDGVLLAAPSYLADLARPRTLGVLWKHANGWARLRHQSPAAVARAAAELRATPYRAALLRAAHQLEAGTAAPTGWTRWISWLDIGGVSAWATQDARRLAADFLRTHADRYEGHVPGEFGMGDSAAWVALNAYARGRRADVVHAATCGVTLEAPFLDDGVIRACWSVPSWVRTTPARAKPLLRRAVEGVVPPRALARSTKGDYTEICYLGIRNNAVSVDELLWSSRLSELGLIDVDAVRAEVCRAVAGVRVRLGALDALLGAELWLRSIEKPSSPWEDRDALSA